MGDVIASIVEKVLMNTGIALYSQVRDGLATHGLTFSDSYHNPDVLVSVLAQVFGDRYSGVAQKIRDDLRAVEDDNHRLANFIQKISG